MFINNMIYIVLKNIAGRMMIEHIILRLKKAQLVDDIYICTSTHPDDQILKEVAKKNSVKFYAGSEESVIDRMLDVAKFEKVIGKSNNAEAKIAGITPAVLIFRGKCDDSPP